MGGFNARERGKQGVLVNKPHREGIECLRKRKASIQFQQTSLREWGFDA
jgi:hypothetical protein